MTTKSLSLAVLGAVMALLGVPGLAKSSLGIFGEWGAFAEPQKSLCYAITQAQPDPRVRERSPYLTVSTWPNRRINGQLYFRLARTPASPSAVSARIGGRSFRLRAGPAGAWTQDARMDAAMKAAMRSAPKLSLYYSDDRGRKYSERYKLKGAASALDAATLACART